MTGIINKPLGSSEDLTGKRFGRLVVKEYVGRYSIYDRDTVWTCQCDCGRVKLHTKSASLKNGSCQSCGCKAFEEKLWLLQDKKPRNALGIAGIERHSRRKGIQYRVCVAIRDRAVGNRGINRRGRLNTLYYGPDFFEACCVRKSYENERLRIGNFV